MKEVSLDKSLRAQLVKKFSVSDQQIDNVIKLFNDLLKPEIEKNYLSHLKSSIEDLINEREKVKFLEVVAADQKDALDKLIQSKRLRLFTILLKPLGSSKRLASTRVINGTPIIFYFPGMDNRQKRVLIAHELGHIALRFLGSEENDNPSENTVNLFAFIAMHDKNQFYRLECKEFTYDSVIELLDAFTMLCYPSIRTGT
jgi:Zn-dependent peptidase ImmA (M78 family)